VPSGDFTPKLASDLIVDEVKRSSCSLRTKPGKPGVAVIQSFFMRVAT